MNGRNVRTSSVEHLQNMPTRLDPEESLIRLRAFRKKNGRTRIHVVVVRSGRFRGGSCRGVLASYRRSRTKTVTHPQSSSLVKETVFGLCRK